MEVTTETWPMLYQALLDKQGDVEPEQRMTVMGMFHLYSICPLGIFTELSCELWTLYNVLQGASRCATPAEYYALPAVYGDAVVVIGGMQ